MTRVSLIAGRPEQTFQALLEAAPDAMVIVDGRGSIVLVNAQTERLFGYVRQELLGQSVDMLVPERFRDRHVEDRARYSRDPRVRPMGAGLELYGRHRDGSEFPVEISLSPIEDDGLTLFSSAIRDITDRKRIEAALKEKNSELENANLAKDRFVARMSHELRTPLNAILGFTGTLLMKLPGPLNAEQEHQLQIVQSSARNLLFMINDILDLAKVEADRFELLPEPVVVERVVEEVVKTLRGLAEQKGLSLDVTATESETVVVTDRRATAQILTNLVSNAIKFTEKGSVCIESASRESNGRREVAVSVTDTGVGIKPEDRERLFKAFEQLDSSNTRRADGTGLGLYLSRRLATLLGGRLEFTTEYGKGSTFVLIVPQAT